MDDLYTLRSFSAIGMHAENPTESPAVSSPKRSRFNRIGQAIPRRGVIVVLLVMVTVIVFASVLGYGFLWDDTELILDDPRVSGGVDAWGILTQPYAPKSGAGHSAYYRPLVTLSFRLTYLMGGEAPAAQHAVNLLFHIAVCVFVLVLGRTITGSTMAATFLAFLFATHPAHAPAVAWIAGRVDLLSGMFLVAGMWLYMRGDALDRSRKRWWALPVLIAAMFSKEVAIVVPLAVLILDWSGNQGRGFKSLDWVFHGCTFLACAVFVFVHQLVTESVGESISLLSLWSDAPDILYRLSLYERIALLPIATEGFYFGPDDRRLVDYVLAVALLGALVALVVRFHRNRSVVVGSSFLVLFALPVLGLVPLSSKYEAADHLCYMPSLGGLLLLTGILQELIRSFRIRGERVWLITTVTFSLVFAVLTVLQLPIYRNQLTLSRHLTRVAPSGSTFTWLGHALREEGRDREAMEAYKEGTRLDTGAWEQWYCLAQIAIQERKFGQAEEFLIEALRRNEVQSDVLTNLGNIETLNEDLVAARSYFQRAVNVDPLNFPALFGLGNTMYKLGQHQEARPILRRFVDLAPAVYAPHKHEAIRLLGKH